MGGATFLGNMEYVPCVVLRDHLAAVAKSDGPTNGPHIVQAPSPYSLRSIASLTFVKGSLCGDPEAMRWEQGVCFCNFPYFHVPTWEVVLVTFQRPQVEHICGIEGYWCQVIMFRRIS